MRRIAVLFLAVVLLKSLTVAVCPAEAGIDYSKPENWLARPACTDGRARADKSVDVFYLYPTAWQKADPGEPNICLIDNPSMRKGSRVAFDRQATAFTTVGNIYAPYYRQVDAAYCLALPLAKQLELLGGAPKKDVLAAFDYYIRNCNHGRPFLLAGHSQGSELLLFVLSEYFKEHPAVYARMVAAYVVGYSVTPDYLAENPHLKFATGPNDTGVVVSYNTEAPQVEGSNPVLLPGALAINPITWTRAQTPATRYQSLGSRLPDAQGRFVTVRNYADARVDKARGVVVCSTADVKKLSPGNQVFGKGVYHSYDYSFYYFNLRQNAENRARRFLNAG